jgi:hypothetical protein
LVKCNDKYVWVDTTWGDPVFQDSGETADEQELKIREGYISYDYMNCNDTILNKTHVADSTVAFPKCETLEFNYYVVNGMYYETYDSNRALAAMNATIDAKSNPTIMKFANEEVYNQAHDNVLQVQFDNAAQHMYNRYGIREVRMKYFDDAETYKIEIYWEY